MTAGEIMQMADDTSLIVFQNKRPIQAKKAFQFELFPQPKYLLNQSDYTPHSTAEQLAKFDQDKENYKVYMKADAENRTEREKEQSEEREKEKEQKEKEIVTEAASFFKSMN